MTKTRNLGVATAFFYENQNSQLFLITNWHVVTGRKPSSPWNSKTGAIPSLLKLKLHRRQEPIGGQSTILVTDIDEVHIPINSVDGSEPRWA